MDVLDQLGQSRITTQIQNQGFEEWEQGRLPIVVEPFFSTTFQTDSNLFLSSKEKKDILNRFETLYKQLGFSRKRLINDLQMKKFIENNDFNAHTIAFLAKYKNQSILYIYGDESSFEYSKVQDTIDREVIIAKENKILKCVSLSSLQDEVRLYCNIHEKKLKKLI